MDFPSTTFKTLRVTIDGTTTPNLADYSSANAVGFSEIAIPGATPIAETLRLPTDLLSNAGTHSLSHRLLILLNRLVLSDHPMSRTFTLTTARRFTLTGTTRLNLTITDPQLNAVLGRTGPGASQRVPSGASNYVVGTNASSRLLGSYLASSWSAIDGNPSTAWSPKLGSSIGQWMSVSTSRPTTLSRVTLSLLNDGHHSIPTELTLSDGTHQDTFGVTGVVPPKVARPGQVVTVPVTLTTPLSGQNFTLRVDQVTPPVIPDYIQGGAASLPIGIAELSLPGVVAPSTPLQLPATCRSDLASLDGSPVSISPMGTTAALLANRAIPATTCGASASGLSMQAGTHTFVGVLSPQVPLTLDTVALGSAVGGAPLAWSQTSGFALPATAPALSVQTSHATRTSFDGTYVADGTAKWLVFGQSLSRGWKLTVDGHGIGTLPELIDGYANGWRLPAYPAGTTVHVQVVWAPQKVVNVAIYLSMLGLAVVLGILVAEVVRRRRRGRHRSSVLVRPNQFLADLEPRWHLPWRDELVPLPRSAYVVAGLAVLLGAAFTSPFAIVPLGLGAAVVLVAPRGRFLLGAAIALLLSAAAISVALGAHTYHWNILWPTHFALANSFVWMAVTLAFVEATIELAERRHDLLAITAPAWPTTTPRPPTPPPPVPTDAIADTPAAGAPAWSLPTGDAEVARVTPVPSPSAAASSTPAVPVAAAALGWATPTGATATPQGDESQDEREVLGGSPTGLRRSLMLYRAFKVEQSDPDHFYRTLAEDTASQLAGYAPLYNRILVDIGGGPGYFSEAFEERGARCLLVEPEARPVELRPPGLPFASNDERHDYAVLPGRLHRARTVAGDGMRLPLPDNCCDIAFSSNVLEHVPDPAAFIDESLRITKPNGTVYLSYTVWSSPWGGHETSPWHLFGGRYAARRYERKHGRPPGNLYGQSLFKVRVREVLKLVRDRDDVAKLWAFPRYYPAWAAWIIHVPVLREFVTWNLVVVLRKDAPRTTRGAFDRSSRPARRTPPPPSPAN